MGLAKVNIWVSERDEPCLVSKRTWYITIYNCDGTVLEWSGHTPSRYAVIPAPNGHLEVEVPPGCYYVKAVWSYVLIPDVGYRVNHFTDATIVQAVCDKTTCVKLFNPSAHRCGYIYIKALIDLQKQKVIKPDMAERAIEGIRKVLEALPRPINKFELGHEEEIERLIREHSKEEKRKEE